MEFDELIHAMYSIARQSHHEEIQEQVYLLAREVGKYEVSEGNADRSEDRYPFSRLINDLESLADRARYTIDQIELMGLREQLLSEGIAGYVSQ